MQADIIIKATETTVAHQTKYMQLSILQQVHSEKTVN